MFLITLNKGSSTEDRYRDVNQLDVKCGWGQSTRTCTQLPEESLYFFVICVETPHNSLAFVHSPKQIHNSAIPN